jgi:xylitol oxidase
MAFSIPIGLACGVELQNWAGNYTYRAREVHTPSTFEELHEVVTHASQIQVLGSRHSFTDIGDSAELVSLDALPSEVVVDREQLTVTCGAAVRYGELSVALEREGLALANLASLPHIGVAGAVSTATHGSGEHNGNLASGVSGLELLTSDGRLLTIAKGEPEFDGAVVGLGALGVLTRITLAAQPFYEVRQQVFEPLAWETLFEGFDEIMARGYSVSVFTRWGEEAGQVWVKARAEDRSLEDELLGVAAATSERHPIDGLDPVHATPQLGVAGPWFDRLPHFRMGFTPSSGAEIQSEYIVARRHARDAIEAVRSISATVGPLTQVSEIRTVAADSLWMSPQYAQDTVAIHFTWKPRQHAVERAVADLERALEPFAARPHWGKLFLAESATIASLYERLPDFRELSERLDPRGAFRNPWLERHVLGGY